MLCVPFIPEAGGGRKENSKADEKKNVEGEGTKNR